MEDRELIELRKHLQHSEETIRNMQKRAGVARELNDAALQALIAVEMQVDIVRTQAAEQSNPIAAELGRIQSRLREELLKLRELITKQRPDVDSSNLLQFLRNTVERFQRETDISARFVSELDEVHMPQQVCREVVDIVQERLVRVRSHTATQHVVVRLAATDSHWQLVIEDDGRFYKDSMVIQERVRLIEGEFTVESKPGIGSRLVVIVPKERANDATSGLGDC